MPPSTRDGLCERRPWDSKFFGLEIAQVRAEPVTDSALGEAAAWADANRIDCLYLLIDDGDPAAEAAARNGFEFVDLRLTLERPVRQDERGSGLPARAGSAVRAARASDLPALAAIARASHRNTRFHLDRRFDPHRSDDLYAVWIERAVDGELADAVWVAELDGRARGYVTVSAGQDAASIGLVAVEEAVRGRNYGRLLVRTTIAWTADRGLPRLRVVTQGTSESSVRFYEALGFAPRRRQRWFHRWPPGRSRPALSSVGR
jgi:GNAT superfamily N-acetyltransferase